MSEQAIISFLTENGPSTPAKLAKHLNTSLLFASAMMGEVSSKGLVKVSKLKIGGGSPLYYLKEHADQLQNFSNNLGPKDKEGYNMLMEKKARGMAMLPGTVSVLRRYLQEVGNTHYTNLIEFLPYFPKQLRVAKKIVTF